MGKMDHIYKEKVKVRGKSISVWPIDTEVQDVTGSPMTYITKFDDIEKYHDKLRERILELETDEGRTHKLRIGGSKVRYVHEWGTVESKLINARATALFCQAVGRTDAVVTASWASISRKHGYLSPHSHLECVASVVYMLDPGNSKNDNGLDGRFAIVDPRAPGCCDHEEDRMTTEIAPDMHPGSMMVFPSQLVHHVHPYTGDEPRITLAWNFALSGE